MSHIVKALRVAHYTEPGSAPKGIAMRETDLQGDIDTTVTEMLAARPPGTFLIAKAIDVPVEEEGLDDIVVGTRIAEVCMKDMSEHRERERNCSILFFWLIEMLGHVKDDGVVIVKDPSPLEPTDITAVLQQIAADPGYSGQGVVVPAENKTKITMRSGQIDFEGPPS